MRIALSTGCRLWTCQTSKWHSHSCIHSSHGDIWVGLNIWNTLALLQCWSILWVCSISSPFYNSWVQFQRKLVLLVEVLKMANTSNSHDMWSCETELGGLGPSVIAQWRSMTFWEIKLSQDGYLQQSNLSLPLEGKEVIGWDTEDRLESKERKLPFWIHYMIIFGLIQLIVKGF